MKTLSPPVLAALAPALAAALTGFGVLGFVTFFGGAVYWVRATEAGLPESEVVSVLPTSVLLAEGGHFLAGALILAFVAVVLMWVPDYVLQRRGQARQAELEDRRADIDHRLEGAKRAVGEAQDVVAETKENVRSTARALAPLQEAGVPTENTPEQAAHQAARKAMDAAEQILDAKQQSASTIDDELLEWRKEKERADQAALAARVLVVALVLLLLLGAILRRRRPPGAFRGTGSGVDTHSAGWVRVCLGHLRVQEAFRLVWATKGPTHKLPLGLIV